MLFSIKLYNFHHRNSIVHAYKSSAELNCGPPTSVRLPHLTAKAAPIRVLPFLEQDTGVDLHFLSFTGKKIKVSPPSSWRQADVPRTSAFRSVQLPSPLGKPKDHPVGGLLVLEQDTGVEPAFTAWEAVVLPIYESCIAWCGYYIRGKWKIQPLFVDRGGRIFACGLYAFS